MPPQFVGAATRGERRLAATSKATASPRGRASHKNSTRALILWEARPAANADSQPPQKQKLRPEVGPPTKTVHAPSFVGGPTRGECRLAATSKAKASPRGRASHEKQCMRPQFVGAATRGECRLAATSLKSESFGPRSGLPQNSARAFICGSRDPRRMQTRSHLKSKSFAPRSGLLHGVQPAPSQFYGRHLKADECPPTVGQIDKRSARCDCHARWPSGSRPSPMLHPNSSSALPARRASRSNAEPRSDNAPG